MIAAERVNGRFVKCDRVAYESGDKYGFLTLTGKCYTRPYGGINRKFVEFICQCGEIKFVCFDAIRNGNVKSCGCHKDKLLSERSKKHGMSGNRHPIYSAHKSMISRCYNDKDINFHNYGGRGVYVCEEWLNNFEAFKQWSFHNGWEEGLTLDRIDNEFGIYEPSNCQWVTYYKQARNKRTNNWVTAFGETKCFKDWTTDERCLVAYSTLFYRINTIKWDAEEAMTTLPLTKNRK